MIMIVSQDLRAREFLRKKVQLVLKTKEVIFAKSLIDASVALENFPETSLIISNFDLGKFSGFDLINVVFGKPIPIILFNCTEHEFNSNENFGFKISFLREGFSSESFLEAYESVKEGGL